MNRAERRAVGKVANTDFVEKASMLAGALSDAKMIKTLRSRAFWMGFCDGLVVGVLGGFGAVAVAGYYGVL